MALALLSLGGATALAQTPVEAPVVAPEKRSLVEYDEYTGRFEAMRRVEVRARVSGFLEEVVFQEGQLVEEGDPLFLIDQRPFRVALEAARAEEAESLARRNLAKLEAKRASRLLASRTIPQEQYDQALAEEYALGAQLANRKARVADAELRLAYTEVRAPISGRIGQRLVDEGNLISGGSDDATLLTTIVQEDPIYFTFEVSEAAFLKYTRLSERGVRPSSRTTPNAVSVKLLDEEDFLHHGVMDFVDNELDASSGTLQGRAVFANPGSFLQPGVFGRLRLQGSGLYDAILVPDDAIQFDQSRQFVFVIDAESRAKRRWVTSGPIIGDKRVIREGLVGDERVIVGNFHRVRLGAPVEALEAPGAAGP